MVSVVIPISERHDEIGLLYEGYKQALLKTGLEFEMIFVVDGSFSEAYLGLKSLKEKGAPLTIVKLARTFGEAVALNAGFQASKGDVFMTLPAYHQVEPDDLEKLFSKLDESDLVVGYRWPRIDSRLNQLQTKLFRSIMKSMTGWSFQDLGCSVRIMKRKVVEEISLYGDLHRFIPLLAYKQGFKVSEVPLRQSSREKQLRTYAFGVYIRRLLDLLTVFFLVKFTRKPLRFFGLTGSVILGSGLLLTAYLVVGRLFMGVDLRDRPMLLFGVLLVVLGIQVFAIGLIGEIIIFTHARETKEYTIEEISE